MRKVLFGLSKSVGALALAAGLFSAPAAALTIPFEVENLRSPTLTPAEFTGGLSIGDPFSLTIDPVAATPTNTTDLSTTASSLSLTVGGTVVTFDQPGNADIRVTNGSGGAADFFELDYSGSALIDNTPGSAFFYLITLRFVDNEGLAFSSADLPTSFDFSLFETRNVIINGLGIDEETLQGNAIASVTTVPLPGALPLLLSALGGFGFLAARRKKAA